MKYLKLICTVGIIALMGACSEDSTTAALKETTVRLKLNANSIDSISQAARNQLATNGVSLSENKITEAEKAAIPSANLSTSLQQNLMFKDDGGTIFTITQALVNVRHIEFSSANSSSVKFDGPYVFDMIAGTATPSLAALQVPEGSYKRIDIRVDDAKVADGDVNNTSPLADNSLYLKGRFSYDGTDGINFSIALQFNEDIRFESDTSITITAGESLDITGSMIVINWFKGINITQCLDNQDMTITSNQLVIDDVTAEGDCKDIEGIVKTNMKKSSVLQ